MKIKDEIIKEFDSYLNQRSLTLFTDIRKVFLTNLKNKLISNFSSNQLKQNILIIEEVKFLDNTLVKTILNLLDDNHNPSLQASKYVDNEELTEAKKYINRTQTEPFKIAHYSKNLSKRINLHIVLINIHQKLFDHYQIILAQTHFVKYDHEALENSFHILSEESKKSYLSDRSNQKADVTRKGITFNGHLIDGDFENYLEQFASSKTAAEGSAANKIYHFGGQYLMGIFCNEFIHSLKIYISGAKIESIGYTKNKPIAWFEGKDKTFYANIEFQVLSVMDKTANLYIINSDDYSITKISPEESELYDEIWNTLKDEHDAKITEAIVPLAEVRGRVSLISNDNGSGHFLKVTRFDIKYNSQQITHVSKFKENDEPLALSHLNDFSNEFKFKMSS